MPTIPNRVYTWSNDITYQNPWVLPTEISGSFHVKSEAHKKESRPGITVDPNSNIPPVEYVWGASSLNPRMLCDMTDDDIMACRTFLEKKKNINGPAYSAIMMELDRRGLYREDD